MSGGIIIQRRAVLLPAVMDPSIYGSLSDATKDAVEAVNAKGPGDTTDTDIAVLVGAIAEATGS